LVKRLERKRERRENPVLSSLPVMPDPDPASPLPRKSKSEIPYIKSGVPYRIITG
jgi:hypothetical protein